MPQDTTVDSPDQKLQSATIAQLVWKNPTFSRVAAAILSTLLLSGRAWPDQVPLAFVGENDKKVIGLCWRTLAHYRLIRQNDRSRKSVAPEAHSRRIFEYELVNRGAARALLNRLSLNLLNPQPELFDYVA